jgi:tetratricopeptide (TPR) repeat protein
MNVRKAIILLVGILISVNTFSNVNYIEISKISNESKFVTAFNYIKDNQQYFDHWTNEWSYDKSQKELVKNLRDNYAMFSSVETKNEELFMLLGDIAHYLYNLNESDYYQLAVNNYNSAIAINPNDYRAYWFLGYHYVLSNVPTLGIDNFLKAQQLLPTKQPADFWEEYAWATAATNMPSHCIYAMDKARSISGTPGRLESQLGPEIHKRIIDVNKDIFYKKEDIWSTSKGEKIAFTCRPLGIKILVDSTWKLSVYDYKNHQSAFVLNPPAIKSKKGQKINYTVAIIMKAANLTDELDDYINTLNPKGLNKSKITFSDKYENMVAYEMKDNKIYKGMGGGHVYMIGIERNSPLYPGLLLENPAIFPDGNKSKVTYYTAKDSKGRFEGKIFYAIMLDSCEEINEQSLAVFKTLFNNQIIIE